MADSNENQSLRKLVEEGVTKRLTIKCKKTQCMFVGKSDDTRHKLQIGDVGNR